MEFLSGVPGTIGGAIRMNAGAYGRELCDVIVSAEAVGSDGRQRIFDVSELGLSYRECSVPEGWIFVSATLRGVTDARRTIEGQRRGEGGRAEWWRSENLAALPQSSAPG